MAEPQYEIGMIGLGVMGQNLALNIADQGCSVVGTDKEIGKVQALRSEAKGRPLGVLLGAFLGTRELIRARSASY
jgi:6-phosphogluconate dehydrogenase